MKFEGQVLVVNTKDNSGGVIQSPELVDIEGRRFIRGSSVTLDNEGSPLHDRRPPPLK